MLDGGPARIPKGRDRRSAYRRESEYFSPDEKPEARQTPAPVTPEPRVDRDEPRSPNGNSGLPKWLSIVIASAIAIILIVGGVMYALSSMNSSKTGIDESKHQAVFFSTGQVYFGKLEVMNDNYMRLTDVFYIQSGDSNESSTESPEAEDMESVESGSMQLIKLGEEVHAPEDEIMINREHILFYENIRPEGRVSQLIEDYKSGSN